MEKWNAAWSDENYEWPVTSTPEANVVDELGKRAVTRGGGVVKEAHADRGVVMDFPNRAVPGSRIRKQIPRTECRRRAQVTLTDVAKGPVKACIVCDAVNLWPNMLR